MTTTTPSLAELLERNARGDADRARRGRELAAELAVLFLFDTARHAAGHDYGRGQRAHELNRRERELDAIETGGGYGTLAYRGAGIREVDAYVYRGGKRVDLEELTPAELRAAYERVAIPRLARIGAEGYRAGTQATKRTVATWDRVGRGLHGFEVKA